MPQVNRDKESLYPPGKLSKVFLVSSVALLAALAWMLLADHYARPWRGVQRAFYESQAKVFEDLRAIEQERLNRPEARKTREDLVAAIRKAEAAKAAKKDELDRMAAELAELKEQEAGEDSEVKAVKGTLSAERFEAEMIRARVKDGKADREDELEQLAVVNDLASKLGRHADRQRDLQARIRDLQRRLDEADKERKSLVDAYAAAAKALTDREKSLEGARAKVQKDQWRNQFLADIVSPTIRIEKVVLEHIHDDYNFATSAKVDMCVTCHMGVDSKEFQENPDLVAKHAIAAVHRPHPAFDLIMGSASKHPKEKFGCTVCHQGRGWSTDFQRAFHTPRWSHREAEALRVPLERDVAAKRDALDAARSDLAAHPSEREKYEALVASARTALTEAEKRLAESRVDQEHRWVEEWGWKPFEFFDWPMLPLRYVEGQCLKCHQPALFYEPPSERLVQWEPDRDDVTGRIRRDDKGAAILKVERDKDDQPILEDGRPVHVRAKAPNPIPTPSADVERPWHPEKLERGMTTMLEWGCVGCHVVKDFGVTAPWPEPNDLTKADLSAPSAGDLTTQGRRRVGPSLTHVADKTTREFLERWIANPTSYRIDTRMPAFYRYRVHDDDYRPATRQETGPDGATKQVFDDRTVIVEPDAQDLARIDVEVQAITQFLWNKSAKPGRQYPAPPAGDPEKGRVTADTVGCAACHLLPERRDASGTWGPDDGARFRGELPPGPRLTALGSKVNAGWLDAWLKEPRHYWAATNMPNMRWKDEMSPDNATVVRSADQVRADVVAWLMSFRDEAFEAQPAFHPDWRAPGSVHKKILDMMYEEYLGKDLRPDVVATKLKELDPAVELYQVGEKLVGQRGCFACHNVAGFEASQPIGTALRDAATGEGSKDLHKLDFGLIGHDEVPHTRWDWIAKKIENPRIYDRGRIKVWTDKLRMPKFNFRARDREAVVTTVLGLVKEPLKPAALFQPNERQRRIVAGRAVIERYNCNQCHNVEGIQGVLWADQVTRGKELWMLPPNLFGEGNRVRSTWLFKFLKAPFEVRPSVLQRMPMFRMSDAEATALVEYFLALSERPEHVSDPEDAPLDATPYANPVTVKLTVKDAQGNDVPKDLVVRDAVEEAKALFDTMGCVKCHLPKGTPGADPNEGASAPPFTLARERLQRAWTRDMLEDPQYQIQGTKMVAFWGKKSRRAQKPGSTRRIEYPEFRLHLRETADAKLDDVSDAQMDALARYLIYHYTLEVPPAGAGR